MSPHRARRYLGSDRRHCQYLNCCAILGNDSDADNAPLIIANVGNAVNDTAVLNLDGTVTCQLYKRIFLALLLSIACFAAGWFVLLADEYKQLGKHIAGAAGFVSNLLFWQESGYFDNAADTKPLLHLWSLGIEEQFYIV